MASTTLERFQPFDNIIGWELNRVIEAVQGGRNGVVTVTDPNGNATILNGIIQSPLTGPVSITGDLTVTGKIVMSTTSSQLVPGATQFAIRNNANSADNLTITNVGDVTVRNNLTVTGTSTLAGASATSLSLGGNLTFTPTAARVVPGATSFSLRNNANSADNLLVVDAGTVTARTEVDAPALKATGLTGAATASRYVGATAGGPPTSGTFAVGDYVIDTVYPTTWVCITAGSPGSWRSPRTKIDDQTVSGVGTVTIPPTGVLPTYFTHLEVIADLITNQAGASALQMQFNGDTGANYNWGLLFINKTSGSTAQATSGSSANVIRCGDAGTAASQLRLEIKDYNGSRQKMCTFQSFHISTGPDWQHISGGGHWSGTGAITTLSLFPPVGTFTGRVTTYGIS